MNINELKIGDRIKFHYHGHMYANITKIKEDRIFVHSKDINTSIHKSDVISKLQPIIDYKEIPIEHPPENIKFNLQLTSIDNMYYNRYHSDKIMTIEGVMNNDKGLTGEIVIKLNNPIKLNFNKTYTIEIKEKE